MPHICQGCGAEFTPRRTGGKPQRFCSKPCRLRWASDHRWDNRQPKIAPCVVCGTPTRSHTGVALCDSDACRRDRAELRRLLSKNGYIGERIDYFGCKECGALFVGKPRSNRLYCTRECATRASKRVGKHRRRTAERVGDFITTYDLGVRDGWRCHICGKKITLRAGGDAMSPSIDHLIPVAADGPHTWANVAIAHKGCNSKRRLGGLVQLRLH